MALVLKSNKSYNGSPSLLPKYNIADGATKIYATYLVNFKYVGAIADLVNSTGKVMEIWAEDDGYLSASKLIAFAKGGNVAVKRLYNQGVGGSSAERTDANYQPLIVENGVVVTNQLGKPSMRCFNARGLVDRDMTGVLSNSKLQYFLDAEPVAGDVKNRNLLTISVVMQGQSSNFLTSYGAGFDNYSNIFTRNYDGATDTSLLFGKQESSRFVALFEYDFSEGYVEATVNSKYKKVSGATRKPISINNISIASGGSSFDSVSTSFNGVFNCLIIK